MDANGLFRLDLPEAYGATTAQRYVRDQDTVATSLAKMGVNMGIGDQ